MNSAYPSNQNQVDQRRLVAAVDFVVDSPKRT